MLENFKEIELNSTPHSFTGEKVAAYMPEKHISTLPKSLSRYKSAFIFPKEYLDENNLMLVNFVLQVLRALPHEQYFNIYKEDYLVYDCRQLCKILKEHSLCSSCIEKKAKKQQKKVQPVSPTATSNDLRNAFIFLGSYGLFCCGLGGGFILLYNRFFK